MENSTKFFTWLKSLPVWLRAVVLLLISALALIFSLSFTSCGTPKTIATVQNVNPHSTVTVTMSISNSTTSSTSTDIIPSVSIDSLSNGSNSH